jgi:integrase
LAQDEDEALQKYHEIMKQPVPVASKLVAGLVEGFLDWCSRNKEDETYNWYLKHLTSFTKSLPHPKTFSTSDLKPFHVYNWVDAHPDWSVNYRRGALVAVQRVFNWAEKIGHLDRNPVRHLEKPQATRKEQVLPEKHYKMMLKETKDQAFKDVLTFAWETGARPEEIVAIMPEQCNLKTARIEIEPNDAKGKKKWRVIYMTDTAKAIVARRLKIAKTYLFENTQGRQWNPYSTGCRFYRFVPKLKTRYSLYTFRHTFATRMLEAGMDSLTVSSLLGHSDLSMLSKHYSHVGDKHLLGELKRLNK